VIEEAAITDEEGLRRIKSKDYLEYVVVPLPEIPG
jgi:hypothetical protein